MIVGKKSVQVIGLTSIYGLCYDSRQEVGASYRANVHAMIVGKKLAQVIGPTSIYGPCYDSRQEVGTSYRANVHLWSML